MEKTKRLLYRLIVLAVVVATLLVATISPTSVLQPSAVYAAPDTERQSPDAILVITSLSPNDVSYIQDDPDAPDSNWLVASSIKDNTDVSVSFPTPTGSPTVGADLQEFRALVRQFDEAQTAIPKARIELWENGLLVRAGSDTDVPQGGLVLSFTWNASELSTADGSLVECKVVGIKALGAKNAVDVGAVEWNVTYTPTSSISNTPETWDFGTVSTSSSYETGITYVVDSTGFRITNNVAYDVNITISATGMGSGWLLADSGDPDATHYTLWAGTELTSPDYNIQVTSGGTFLVTVLASSTRDWGLKLMTPTSFSDGGLKSGIVTLTATQA